MRTEIEETGIKGPVHVGIISEKLPGVTPGGAEAVAAWMAQALQADYRVTLLLADSGLAPSDLDVLFGTRLSGANLTTRVMSLPRPLHLVGGFRRLKQRFIVRAYRRVEGEFDLLINASGEGHFRNPGIQYIHFPRALQEAEPGWIHAIYRNFTDKLFSESDSFSTNLTLTNSRWTLAQITRAYGIASAVLAPPIAFSHRLLPWVDRENGFLIIGRLSPEKRVEAAIEILRRVRAREFDVHLHVLGGVHDGRYAGAIARMAHDCGHWITFEGQVPRARLEELIATHRFGIHCMREEHFGMAVAEMTRGGCVVFVPNGGGQVEIVGDPLATYKDFDDAVEKICAVLSSDNLQNRLRHSVASSDALITPDDFCHAFLEHCRMFLEERNRGASMRRLSPAASSSRV